jgi:hypothetical protein
MTAWHKIMNVIDSPALEQFPAKPTPVRISIAMLRVIDIVSISMFR